MKSRALAVSASLSAAALVAAPPIDLANAAPPGGWHVFVYIVNDSEGQLPYGQDIDEMLAASQTGIDFTVYLDSSDTAGAGHVTNAVANTNDALIIEISGGTLAVTQSLGELDSGDPDTLAWFLAQGLLAHQSAHERARRVGPRCRLERRRLRRRRQRFRLSPGQLARLGRSSRWPSNAAWPQPAGRSSTCSSTTRA